MKATSFAANSSRFQYGIRLGFVPVSTTPLMDMFRGCMRLSSPVDTRL
jgi:hypothetical protein